ncbi:hypothetical protein [Bacillus cereus group sp. BfR-BA-01318]|uniref:hypothetical protein n=1 Tax=unclassified Bacillus cereus group TaxID=2750818 RepID=UPI001298D6E7|nr:hypothetical protein [Bacillus cereus group sp. BfR-BA-01318]MEB9419883.1 hypothetical protein [Bacillus cereus]MEB9561614.1 hypothetical protein [Bacillus cereus]MRC02934.1 hypothetical protein [Bacillus thuringiensis]MRD20738.1 hypothetical protein [Bacillus thuringiensis]
MQYAIIQSGFFIENMKLNKQGEISDITFTTISEKAKIIEEKELGAYEKALKHHFSDGDYRVLPLGTPAHLSSLDEDDALQVHLDFGKSPKDVLKK